MRISTLFVLAIVCTGFFAQGQTLQINIGSIGSTQYFADTKINPADGSIVNVGYTNNAATGNDLYIVKLNSAHNLVWQRSISNVGDDNFIRVVICANGDYVAIGQMYIGGIRRGVACRINSTDGSIIWSINSSNSSVGEIFWDVKETANQNIAIAGYESFSPPQTNCFILLLNSAGSKLWSYVSTRADSDGFLSINQLPNGDLIVAGIYIENSGSYNLAILEINETTGAVNTQNTYGINTSIPGDPLTYNSVYPLRIMIKNNAVIFQMLAFQGYSSASDNCIFTYDQTTKNISGNILYHFGSNNANGYGIYPISEDDFLVGSSYTTPISTYVSRITNGSIVFDRKINSLVTSVTAIDVLNTNAVFAGNATSPDLDGYNLFCPINLPVSVLPCDVSDANAIALQAESLSPTNQNALAMVSGGSIVNITLTVQDPLLSFGLICGFIPVTLVNFTGKYDATSQSSLLNWNTATELNSKVFLVERSTDGGRNFVSIGSVNAKGTSNTLTQYQFADKDPQTGINLYRLKEIDIDGKFQYSNIVSIEVKKRNNSIYTVYPIPTHDILFLKTSENKTKLVNIVLMDASGKIIKEQSSYVDNAHPTKIDLSSVAAGIYFVRIASANDETTTEKILLQ